ncbi:MAG: transglycosylase SLT domain-containing protein [Burkholderiaceae bacterium]|jgi:membrane-bound lytic murein transglycosylase D
MKPISRRRPGAPALAGLAVLVTAALSGCATQTPQTPDPVVAVSSAAEPAANPQTGARPGQTLPVALADASGPIYGNATPLLQLPPGAVSGTLEPSDGTAVSSTPAFDNLLERIRAGFAMPELPSRLVDRHTKRFVSNPEYLARVFDRGGRYLHHIVEEIEARGLPTELALLPIVESAFNPQATSHAKAAGLWQFIPSTGRIFNLSQNWWMDERRDVIESTRAALEYLEKIYELQGNDWFLALASYNWGEGAVGRAVRRNKAAGKPIDYLSLKMPKETAHYVPQLIALRNILRDPQAFNLSLPFVENKPYFAVIDKNQSIDLKLAAELAELSLDEFQALNPHLRRPVITVSRTNRVVLPVENIEAFHRNLETHLAKKRPLVTWKPYTLKKGETLASLAKNTGVSAETLAKANSLSSTNARLMPGTTLLAPASVQAHEGPAIETALARFPGARTVEVVTVPAKTYRVRKNDSWASIARRFRVSESRLKSLNKTVQELKAGMRLVLVPARNQTVITDAAGRKTVAR